MTWTALQLQLMARLGEPHSKQPAEIHWKLQHQSATAEVWLVADDIEANGTLTEWSCLPRLARRMHFNNGERASLELLTQWMVGSFEPIVERVSWSPRLSKKRFRQLEELLTGDVVITSRHYDESMFWWRDVRLFEFEQVPVEGRRYTHTRLSRTFTIKETP